MKKSMCFFFSTFLIFMTLRAQQKTNISQSYLSVGVKRLKESANFGLVFNRANVVYGHYWESSKNNTIFSIENEI